jgi:hypothetical protein
LETRQPEFMNGRSSKRLVERQGRPKLLKNGAFDGRWEIYPEHSAITDECKEPVT